MIVFAASAIVTVFPARVVIWASRRIRQRAEVVIEGMVLLHDHDDVLGLMGIAFSCGCCAGQQCCCKKHERNGSANAEQTHSALSFFQEPRELQPEISCR